MPTEFIKPSQSKASSTVNVAVAVIHYQQQYLLGFRNQAQHQGNRYEFVGGKIDPDEHAIAALIREVAEETGIDISNNVTVKLGRLHHDYGDKQVCLQVYKVALTSQQFAEYQHCRFGLEGQALTWVAKSQLLAGDYPLPAANQTILAWLQLPTQLVISHSLAHFSQHPTAIEAWLSYHQQHLPKDAWVYLRIKADNSAQIAAQLLQIRPDIYGVLPSNDVNSVLAANGQTTHQNVYQDDYQSRQQLKAGHLTHTELLHWFSYSRDSIENAEQDLQKNKQKAHRNSYQRNDQELCPNLPLIISCHDIESITAANQLALMRLKQKQPPVVGIFLSPVLATQTHPTQPPLGWKAFASLAQLADMPVIALGGLSPALAKRATQYGAISIAGIREFLDGRM